MSTECSQPVYQFIDVQWSVMTLIPKLPCGSMQAALLTFEASLSGVEFI